VTCLASISRKEDAQEPFATFLTLVSQILIVLRQETQIEVHDNHPLNESAIAVARLEEHNYLFVFNSLPLHEKTHLISILLVVEERKEAGGRTAVAGKVAKDLDLRSASLSTDLVQDPEAKERKTYASPMFQSHLISHRTDTL
jgi:hypothetical protein